MGSSAGGGQGKKLLFVLGLLALVAVAITATGVLGFRLFLTPTTDDGTCFVFDENNCSALSESRVEDAAGVEIPGGATITDSGAYRSLKIGRLSALIRLPENETLGLGPDYLVEASQDTASNVSSYLSKRGISEVDSIAMDAARGSTVYFGHDDDGTRWAYVRVIWDG